ncbi:MAG TPA: hypothetical protein VKB78_01780, partial [Pirellulales bacterium]|nr:hypothetical protein [Pirellulales bacterium]
VVNQSREIHEQIADLLSTVRHVRDEPEKYRDGGLSQQSPAETKIHRLLQSKQDMDFTETPLKDVVESLKLKVGIEIQVDAKAITDSGVSIDAPITFKVKNMRLATALRLMLAPVELSYIIDHEVLLITSAAAANDHVITRLYAVGDLLNQPPDDSASYQELIDLVTSTVHPASWVDAGGTGSIQPFPISKALVCTQTEQGHEEIVELLKRIRSLKPAKSAAATGSDKTSGEPPTRFYRLSPELADGAAEYSTAIKRLVEPSAWAKDDAYIGKVPDGIVARCSPTMHQRIRELLTELEALPPKGAAESGTGIRKKGGVGGQVSGAF